MTLIQMGVNWCNFWVWIVVGVNVDVGVNTRGVNWRRPYIIRSCQRLFNTVAVRIQLFGHSFVSGLKRFIRTDERFKYNFNLQQPALVQYSGYSGARISTLRANMQVVEDYQPHILILLVGTNDIYDVDLSPETLVKQIMARVDGIISLPKVQKCFISYGTHKMD